MTDSSMEQRSPATKQLFEARSLRIFSEGDYRLLIRSGGRLGHSLLMLVVVLLGAFAIFVCTLCVWASLANAPLPAHRRFEPWIGFLCGGIFCALEAAFLYLLVQYITPQWTMIDPQEGKVVRWRIPLIRHTIELAAVESVDLVMVGEGQTHSCFLALSIGPAGHVWAFHWLGGYRRAEAYRDELVPAAKLVASFLGKPLYSSYGRLRRMAWCKGDQREQIP